MFVHKSLILLFTILLMLSIVRLVYHRKLREEYSWLWLLTCSMILLLTLWEGLLDWVTGVIGAQVSTSTLVIFGVAFLLLICLHFTLRLSELTERQRKLAQELTLLKGRLEYPEKDHEMGATNNCGSEAQLDKEAE
jgi:hypothetical protein